MRKRVVIVDYKLGNLFSVIQACKSAGLNAVVSSNKEDVSSADAIILPGVGAFGEAMNHLKDLKMILPIKNHVLEGKPLFGICLGLQLLLSESEEFGVAKGLDIIPGVVKKIPNIVDERKRLVPQIGWNQVNHFEKNSKKSPLDGIHSEEYFYFVHSYYVVPDKTEHVLTTTEYDGLEYCSSVYNEDNVFATQFHPEKSAKKGLEIYFNWSKQYNLI